jgi:hypothetical protein
MFSCKVLVGPIATDKEYHTGDTVCLDKKDADTLSGFGLVEIIGEVQPKFVAQVLPPAEVAGTAPTIDLFPVADEIAPAIEIPAVVTEIAPVVVATEVAATEVAAPEPVIETPVVVETALVEDLPVESIVDETVIVDGEEAIGLEEVAGSTGSKRKK